MKRFLVLAALISFGAEARSYTYECKSIYWNGYNESGTMSLSVNARKATADIHEESWDEGLGGNLNPNYRSRSERPYVKFGGDLIVEKSLLTGGRRMRDGNWGGVARVEGQAEGGFYQYKFLCILN